VAWDSLERYTAEFALPVINEPLKRNYVSSVGI
jgi:hypothetical protein